MSFVQKAGTLEAIITMLEGHPSYPRKAEWSVNALKAKLAELQKHNIAVSEAQGLLAKARGEAKRLAFDRKTGIVGIARMTKRYIKLILGGKADLYRSISKIKFRNH